MTFLLLFQIIGLRLSICIIFFASLTSLLTSLKRPKDERCCTRQDRLNELILEEEENILEDTLKSAVKQRLTSDLNAYLASGQWEKCFDIADNLMDNPTGF